jgi:hypothetical protein
MVQRRRDSHIEGLATHDDPESCGRARKDASEALAGAHAGRVLSREIEFNFQVPSLFLGTKATPDAPEWRGGSGPGAVDDKTPSMRGSTMRENRETLHTARGGWRHGPQWEVQGPKPLMYGAGSLTAA